MSGLVSNEYYFLYASKPAPPDPRGKRTGNILVLLGPTINSLIKSAPKNETFRAKIMAHIGEMPPKDCETYQQIKDWIEFNFPKAPKPKANDPLATLRVRFAHTESGHCAYSRSETHVAQVKITPQMIDEILDNLDNECDFDDVAAEMSSKIQEVARENSQSTGEEDSVITSNEVPDDSSDEDVDYDFGSVKSALRAYIRANYPERADELGI